MAVTAGLVAHVGDIGLKRIGLVGNKVRGEEDALFLQTNAPVPIVGMLPADPAVQDADRLGVAVYDHVPALKTAAEQIKKNLTEIKEAAL